MPIDIHYLDGYRDHDTDADEALEIYEDAFVEQFLDAPESQDYEAVESEAGFWVRMLIHYGYLYEGFTLPRMTADNVEYTLNHIFPRKISLREREEAEDTIPELVAFWRYLQREYTLPQADAVIARLDKLAPRFADTMFDESKYGMAKSFVMAGTRAGFDMTNQDDMNTFMHLYNAQILREPNREAGREAGPRLGLRNLLGLSDGAGGDGRRPDKAKKNNRKMAKASRKKNRKKKRK